MGGVIAGAGGIIGGLLGLQGANAAADTQKSAAKSALQAQLFMYARSRADLEAYRNLGTKGVQQFQQAMPGLTKPFNMTQQQLEQTPGYQFTLDQGLKAQQNAYAAQGLGSSGAAIKGAEQYAEGLASTTFQQQFDNYLKQNMQRYNMLLGPVQVGAGAAAGTAEMGQTTGAQVGQTYASLGSAVAGSQIAGANALSGGINNAISNALQYNLMNKLYSGA